MFANSVVPDQTAPLGPHCLPVCKNRFEKSARMFSRRHFQMQFFLALKGLKYSYTMLMTVQSSSSL